jgi:hypothetical protein
VSRARTRCRGREVVRDGDCSRASLAHGQTETQSRSREQSCSLPKGKHLRADALDCECLGAAFSPIYPHEDRSPEDVPRSHSHAQMRTESWQTTDVSLLVYPYKRGGERANRDAQARWGQEEEEESRSLRRRTLEGTSGDEAQSRIRGRVQIGTEGVRRPSPVLLNDGSRDAC